MQPPYKVMFLFGTRAEVLKLAPIIRLMHRDPDKWQAVLVATAQSDSRLLNDTLEYLRFHVDFSVDSSGIANTNEVDQLSQLLHNLNNVVNAGQPDMVLIAGDATTSLAASLISFYHRIPLGHVEAGLRTYNQYSPFPDEMHRRLTDDLATLYFAPTTGARDNLLQEHHPAERVYVTGNTSIDSVECNLQADFKHPLLQSIAADHRILLMTMRRKDNLGSPMKRVFHTVRDIIETNKDVELIFPVYPHPEEVALADEILDGHERIHLTHPLNHHDFLNIAARSSILLTDSGGLQEEAPALHKPVLLLRDETERQEAVDLGCVKVVGTNPTTIQQAVFELLNDEKAYRQMVQADSPFGDGNASKRILQIIKKFLENKKD
ncbi:UDP-N-acetylglucosamine 2-epimerase (non-hydrolyzing) [Limosilactobacillus sp. STM2_1]|uniref:UDP-N-acetylglucosamine 2-epimerase (non-hydrolyzing) n=1 Tax=Limosilactobacillus rudii TaxID=2759755 RepID=A0A7W3ULJ1_9LACO|nr:UDP-N-acetylglucosamine 2-epimerase (non-hydrolyzing) [Limosilactobacillus rudii]MBB1079776.1 UDP-N-acetylglucosamine 2-epimerase (non-hydrolyzing) [Limosilactobacillus rudii]MBB1097764.1 UDP-N-acetylglucosamine 2-epimerase (non-hydrolyzing) [Limosilactobacillus rudii]MCD7134845.1 UDP-N-acetylglucosamine 2-epimerase (non-hydrolyzing) [Limosilactobacillus rudii]